MTDSAEFTARARALVPDFVLQREIGRGGMGIVYLGMDVKLERPVAIKVLPGMLADVPEVRERFLREARMAAKLSHPNIVPIHRADEMDGVVFIVMTYVEGASLAERLAAQGVLPPQAITPILRDVALALDYAHGHGIVHRDVKPENILVERSTGRAWVTDFGIARLAEAKPLTATGQVLGTVHYMSPEQISGDPVDGRSDLYSLGVVGFRALTGRLPFDNEAASAVLVAHVVKPPPRVRDIAPDVPAALADAIDRCLEKDPASRCSTGMELAQKLDLALASSDREGSVVDAPAITSEGEAEALWSRAAELQAMTGVVTRPPIAARISPSTAGGRRTLTSGYRYEDARAAAVEAGIGEQYVARAAKELGFTPALPHSVARTMPNVSPVAGVRDKTPSPALFAGGPMAILLEAEVSGEVPEAELYVLVDTIRRRLGEAGHVGAIGRSVSWSSAKNRRLQVAIISRRGKTTIRVDERLPQLAGGVFGGIVGGMGGGTGGLAFGIGMGVFQSAAISLGIWAATIAGSYLLARTVYGVQVRKRLKELRALADELVEQASEAIKGS